MGRVLHWQAGCASLWSPLTELDLFSRSLKMRHGFLPQFSVFAEYLHLRGQFLLLEKGKSGKRTPR